MVYYARMYLCMYSMYLWHVWQPGVVLFPGKGSILRIEHCSGSVQKYYRFEKLFFCYPFINYLNLEYYTFITPDVT